jgi:hypothetical protein
MRDHERTAPAATPPTHHDDFCRAADTRALAAPSAATPATTATVRRDGRMRRAAAAIRSRRDLRWNNIGDLPVVWVSVTG